MLWMVLGWVVVGSFDALVCVFCVWLVGKEKVVYCKRKAKIQVNVATDRHNHTTATMRGVRLCETQDKNTLDTQGLCVVVGGITICAKKK